MLFFYFLCSRLSRLVRLLSFSPYPAQPLNLKQTRAKTHFLLPLSVPFWIRFTTQSEGEIRRQNWTLEGGRKRTKPAGLRESEPVMHTNGIITVALTALPAGNFLVADQNRRPAPDLCHPSVRFDSPLIVSLSFSCWNNTTRLIWVYLPQNPKLCQQ